MEKYEIIEKLVDYLKDESVNKNDPDFLLHGVSFLEHSLNNFSENVMHANNLTNAWVTVRNVMDGQEWRDYYENLSEIYAISFNACEASCSQLNRLCERAGIPLFFEGNLNYPSDLESFIKDFTCDGYEKCIGVVKEAEKKIDVEL